MLLERFGVWVICAMLYDAFLCTVATSNIKQRTRPQISKLLTLLHPLHQPFFYEEQEVALCEHPMPQRET